MNKYICWVRSLDMVIKIPCISASLSQSQEWCLPRCGMIRLEPPEAMDKGKLQILAWRELDGTWKDEYCKNSWKIEISWQTIRRVSNQLIFLAQCSDGNERAKQHDKLITLVSSQTEIPWKITYVTKMMGSIEVADGLW